MNKKKVLFFFFSFLALGGAFFPLLNVLRNGRPSWYYTHIPLIPVVSAYLFIRKRKELFRTEESFFRSGFIIMAAGFFLFLAGNIIRLDLYAHAAISTFAAIVFSWGSHSFLFGKTAARLASFPFAFLFFAIPVPPALMQGIVSVLVTASTGVTHFLFKLFGVPFVQEGSFFFLPGFDIEVAQECSGIRSSIALLVTSVLAGHLFLKGFWKKVWFALAVFPITVFKNGVRIITLYLLSYFVDIGIIEGGFLHRSGGFVFFGLGLFIMGGLLWFLRESDAEGP